MSEQESKPRLWRHGDVLIQEVDEIPEGFEQDVQKNPILYRGDASGHHHGFKDRHSVQVYRKRFEDMLFFEVTGEEAMLTHQEHASINFPKGFYRAWRQREFDSRGGSRWVAD